MESFPRRTKEGDRFAPRRTLPPAPKGMATKGARRLLRPRFAGRVLVTSLRGIWIYLTPRSSCRGGEIQGKISGGAFLPVALPDTVYHNGMCLYT